MGNTSFLGCGSWGGTLGVLLAKKGIPVTMWHRNQQTVKLLKESRRHYLISSLTLPENVSLTSDLNKAIQGQDIVILAIPSQTIRGVLQSTRGLWKINQTIVNVSKGIEKDTLMTISDIIKDVLSDSFINVVTLSGPSHAEEVINGHPTTLVAASSQEKKAKDVQLLFSNKSLRIYVNEDIKGVEIGGSIKNVIAIASGILDGLGFGDNTKSALLCRGLSEINRLGIAMGCKASTFSGLSGIGDLIVTCFSKHSRNRFVGEEIAKGRSLQEIINGMAMISEGVNTTISTIQLSSKYSVNMPISQAVHSVLFQEKNPRIAIEELMSRELISE